MVYFFKMALALCKFGRLTLVVRYKVNTKVFLATPGKASGFSKNTIVGDWLIE